MNRLSVRRLSSFVALPIAFLLGACAEPEDATDASTPSEATDEADLTSKGAAGSAEEPIVGIFQNFDEAAPAGAPYRITFSNTGTFIFSFGKDQGEVGKYKVKKDAKAPVPTYRVSLDSRVGGKKTLVLTQLPDASGVPTNDWDLEVAGGFHHTYRRHFVQYDTGTTPVVSSLACSVVDHCRPNAALPGVLVHAELLEGGKIAIYGGGLTAKKDAPARILTAACPFPTKKTSLLGKKAAAGESAVQKDRRIDVVLRESNPERDCAGVEVICNGALEVPGMACAGTR